PFVAATDHVVLKWLHTAKLNGRRARWIIRLQPYNYTIQHRAGKVHGDTDALSRQTEDKPQKIDQPKKIEKEDENIPSTTTEEKEWLLSLADLVSEGHKDQLLKSGDPNAYGDEDFESGKKNDAIEESWWSDKETTEPLNLDAIYSVEPPKWGESTIGVEFSESDSDWGWEEDQCELFVIEKGTGEEEGPEEPIPEAVLKKLNEYRSRAPSREMFMSPLHEARKEMNRKLDMEKFEEDLEKQKPVLEFLLETETAEIGASELAKTTQNKYTNVEPAEPVTSKEEAE
ncbi:15888_t:CDS:2, partial [Gigaspora rosea]